MDSNKKVQQILEILPHLSPQTVQQFVKENKQLDFEASIQRLLDSPQPARAPTQAIDDAADDIPPLIIGDSEGALALSNLGDGDDDLQRALEMSLQEESTRQEFEQGLSGIGGPADCPNPYDRKRVSEDYPCGLKNVGNTCYINSLLQAWFTLVEFRDALLAANVPKPSDCGGDDDCKKLISELQLLFASMLLTKRSYVNPSGVVKLTPHHGQQEDPTEFCNWLMERIHQGFSPSPAAKRRHVDNDEENAATQPMDEGDDERLDLISRFFSGEQTLKLQASELDGSPVKAEDQEEEIRQVIVPVPAGASSLHDCLLEYTSVAQVEGYTTPAGASVTAERITLFTSLPATLTVQLNRISWSNNAPVKNNARVQFPLDLYMDRYMLDSMRDTLARRKVVACHSEEARALETELNSFMHFAPGPMSLSDNLRGTLRYLESKLQQQQHAGQELNGAAEARNLLRVHLAQVDSQVASLEQRLASKRAQIAAAYDEFPRRHHYVLHAILVHSGHPGGGHYWAYVYSRTAEQWWKFNDIGVTPVAPQVVMEQSFGGEGNHTSAYALVYADPERLDLDRSWDSHASIPSWCRELVSADNAAFAAEIGAWDDQNSDEGKVKLFLACFDRCRAEAVALAAESSTERVPSVKSFAAYLAVIGRKDLMDIQCARDAYQEIWKRNPLEDELMEQHSAVFFKAQAALMEKTLNTMKLEGARAQALYETHRTNYELNARVVTWIIQCITAFLSQNLREAFRCLVAAKLLEERIGPECPKVTQRNDRLFCAILENYSAAESKKANNVDFGAAIDIVSAACRWWPQQASTRRVCHIWTNRNRVSMGLSFSSVSVHSPDLRDVLVSRKPREIVHDFARENAYPSRQALFDDYTAKAAMLRAATS